MGVKLNLTQDEINKAKGIFPALPAGVYGAVIFEAKNAVSKSSGNDMYTVTYKITESGTGQGVGRKFTTYYAHSEKAWFKAREFFKALGRRDLIEGIEAGELEFPSIDDLEVLGEEVNLKLKIEEYATEDDDGNDVLGERNIVDRVYVYDESKHTGNEEESAGNGGKFLGL